MINPRLSLMKIANHRKMICSMPLTRWKLYVQIMLKEKAYAYHINLFDWPHGDCSLISVGVI